MSTDVVSFKAHVPPPLLPLPPESMHCLLSGWGSAQELHYAASFFIYFKLDGKINPFPFCNIYFQCFTQQENVKRMNAKREAVKNYLADFVC